MNKYFKYIVLIITFYTILSSVEKTFELNFPIIRYLLITVGSFFIFKIIEINEALNKQYKNLSRLFLFLLMLLFIHSILLGFTELFLPKRNYINLKSFIGNYSFLYSFTLLLFIKPNPIYWKYLVKYSYILLFLLIPFLVLNILPYLSREKSPEGVIRSFAGVSGFLLLLIPYFKPKQKKIILSIFLVSIIFMIYHARRNMVLYFGLFFIFYILIISSSSLTILKTTKSKNIINLFFLFFIGNIIFLMTNPDFSLFIERAETGTESRDGIIEEFFLDVQPFSSDFYLGRGMYGDFYSKMLGINEFGDIGVGVRNTIENGYLHLILKFGFIFVTAFTLLSLIGFYKGFFKSNNLFAMACGVVLMVNLIDMIGFGVPEITFKYFLVWFSFPYCFSKDFRNLSDFQIKKLIFLK
jgi:hypothetical protein